MINGDPTKKPTREESLVNNSIDTYLSNGVGWDQMQDRLDREFLKNVWEPIYNERRSSVDVALGTYPSVPESEFEQIDEQILENREEIDNQFVTDVLGDRPVPQVTDDLRWGLSDPHDPLLPLRTPVILPGTMGQLGEVVREYKPGVVEDYNERVDTFNDRVAKFNVAKEDYALAVEQEKEWVKNANNLLASEAERMQAEKQTELYNRDVGFNPDGVDEYKTALDAGEITQQQYEKGIAAIATPRSFTWKTYVGGSRNMGNMHILDTGYVQFKEQMDAMSAEERNEARNSDPSYVKLMEEPLAGYQMPPMDLINQLREQNPNMSSMELMKTEGYRDAMAEIVRRNQMYDGFQAGVFMKDFMLKNTFEGQSKEQLKAAEEHIYDRFQIKVDLNSDNTIGEERGMFSGLIKDGRDVGDLDIRMSVGGLQMSTGMMGAVSSVMDMLGFDTSELSEGAKAFYSLAQNQLIPDLRSKATQSMYTRQEYRRFKDSPYLELDGIVDRELALVNSLAAVVGQGDSFAREELLETSESAIQNIYGMAVGVGATKAKTLSGLGRGLMGTGKALGFTEAAGSVFPGITSYGNKYLEITSDPDSLVRYSDLVDSNGEAVSIEKANQMLDELGDPLATYEDVGLSYTPNNFKILGHAVGEGALEAGPEVGMNILSGYLWSMGAGTISTTGKQRLMDFTVQFFLAQGINIPEEGATEFITGMGQRWLDATMKGEDPNWNAILEGAKHDFLIGAYSAPYMGGGISVANYVGQERMIAEKLEQNPNWLLSYNMEQMYRYGTRGLSKDAKEIAENNKTLMSSGISESYRLSLQRRNQVLYNRLSEQDKVAVKEADTLLKNHKDTAVRLLAVHNQIQVANAQLNEAQNIEDEESRSRETERAMANLEFLATRQEELQEKAAKLLKTPVTVAVRDGSGNQSDIIMTTRPLTPAEQKEVDGLKSGADQETANLQEESEKQAREYDDDLEAALERERSTLIIMGAMADGSIMSEGSVDEDLFADGVIELLRTVAPDLVEGATSVVHGSDEAFDNDPDVKREMAEQGLETPPNAMVVVEDGKVKKIIVKPGTKKGDAVHEIIHGALREVFENETQRKELVRQLIALGNRAGNSQLGAWLDSTMLDYDLTEEQLTNGDPDISKLTARQEEELIVGFLTGVSTNEWQVDSDISFSNNTRESLSSSFFSILGKLSPMSRKLKVKDTAGLSEITGRLKQALPKTEAKPQQEFVRADVAGAEVTQEGEVGPIIPKDDTPQPSTAAEVLKAAEENSSIKVDVESVPEDVAPGVEQEEEKVSPETAQAQERTVEPKRDTESDADYAARLEREANELLGDLEGISTPETDALSQETEDVTRLSSKERSRRKDWLSGKKVVGTFINSYGYGRSFEIVPNDYFHFRNWHNKITGNGVQPFDRLSYKNEKGESKFLNPPKPRLDKDGNPVKMRPVDIRTVVQKFREAKIAFATSEDRTRGTIVNRFRRLEELAKENEIDIEDLGVSKFWSKNTYAEIEAAEVNLQAMISDEPGAMYPLGMVVPEVGKYAPDLTPKSLDDYKRGRERGFLSADRNKQKRVIKGEQGKYLATQNRKMNLAEAIQDGVVKLTPDFRSFLETLDPATPIFAVVEKYAPIEPADIMMIVGGQKVNFTIEGGAFASVVDYQDRKKQSGMSPSPSEVAAISNSKKGQRNRAFNTVVTDSQDFGAGKAIVFVKDLGFDNPLGDKSGADGIFKMLEVFAEQGDEQALMVAKALNDSLAKTFDKGGKKRERGEDVYEVADENQVKLPGFKVAGTNAAPTLRIDDSSAESARSGISNFRKLFIDFRGDQYIQDVDNISFFTRKSIVDDMLKPKSLYKGGKAENLGFPPRQRILDIMGVSESVERVKTQQEGATEDILYAVVIDVNQAKKGRFPSEKGRQYPHYMTGFEAVHVFGKPVSESEVKKRMLKVDQEEGTETFRGAEQAMASGYKGRLMSRNRAGRIYTHGNSWQKSTETGYGRALGAIALKFQDKFFDVMMLQSDVENFKDAKVAENEDFDMAIDLMYGRAASRLDLLTQAQEQIQARLKQTGITSDDLSTFLYARHVKERNRQIHRINPDQKAGSGQTNAWAEGKLKELDSAEMRQVANMVYSIIQNTRKVLVESGLSTKEEVQAWEDMYENYVPLAGLALDEQDENNLRYPTGGSGMAVYGNLIKKAKGRKSEVTVNVVAQAIMQNAMVIQAAEKNRAMQTLYELVKNNPNQKVWAIVNSKNPLTSIGDDGLPRQMTVAEMKLSPHTVPVRIDGKQEFIYFKDKNHANTLNGATVERAGFIVRSLNNVTGWLRNVMTIYDPNFFITNFARDFQTAIPNAIAEAEREGGNIEGIQDQMKFTKDVMNNIQKSLRSLFGQAAFGKEMDTKIEEYHREWELAGGKTGWGYTKDISQLIQELEKSTGKKGALDFIFGTPKKFATFIEGINDSFEQATRLGAYIAARENGVSVQRAAQLSKNVTVNFNRGGEYQFLNSVYLFFNAAMQGNARLFKTMFYLKDVRKANGELESWHKRVSTPQKIAFSMSLLSGLITLINLAMSGNDEEGDGELWYNKISDYEKERNIIIMRRDGKNYMKIPLPYGYNIFNNFGSTVVETSTGNREAWDGMMFLLNSAISSFSPISFGQSKDATTYGVKAITPTIAKPLVEISTNETYFGSQVYRDRLPYDTTPYSDLAYRSPEFMQEFFAWMNESTGGSKHRSGDMDVNPDKIWYLFEYFIGGAGRFVNNSGELIYNGYEMSKTSLQIARENGLSFSDFKNLTAGFQGENKIMMEPSDIPIARKVYGSPSRFFDADLFRNNSMDVMQLSKELKEAPNFEREGRYVGVQTLDGMLKQTNDLLKEIRKFRRLIRDSEPGFYTYTEKANELAKLEEAERQAMARFNGAYERLRGPQEN